MFQQAKGQAGLDHYQCRGWTAWHRFTVLAMLALTITTITTIADAAELIPITVPEARRLINPTHHTLGPARLHDIIAWPTWRRRHQARARISHYKHRHQLELSR